MNNDYVEIKVLLLYILNEYSACLPYWEIVGFRPRWFELCSSQTNGLKGDTCHFLARSSALLGYGKDWLVQCW